jgi:hypothetical protein
MLYRASEKTGSCEDVSVTSGSTKDGALIKCSSRTNVSGEQVMGWLFCLSVCKIHFENRWTVLDEI